MEEIAQEKSNNLKMKKSQILHLHVQSPESVLSRAHCCVFMALYLLLHDMRAFTGYPNVA